MRTLILLFIAATAFAQRVPDQWTAWGKGASVHPFRKVGTRHYDLRPLFTWAQNPHRQQPQPLPEWQLFIPGLEVSQVFTDGLLCGGETKIIIRHHPQQSTAVDHTVLPAFFACKLPERHQYHTIVGAVATVDQYDYGEPFDPAALAREVAAQRAAAAEKAVSTPLATNPPPKTSAKTP